ncbi:alpha-2,8-polysialyltransferase family protein [Flavobacterium lacus]|uniref:Uncharacterized protein n=1 Tax=Flavobacterium lacus TaxID=1353778 RepID=A0A328WLM0_9FLAO|nr:alpha-2,8-polysialyltransferase family protein [Flavobacterium lacus]RAR47242.1 hypothetical protein B0I10_11035 [Flavobacterium lacus]
MKYIFTVHSPITFLMCISIVRHEKLLLNDVIIITSDYKLPIQVGKVVSGFAEQNKSLFKKIKSVNAVKSFDKYVYQITEGDDFTAFIDIMHNYQKLLVTNKRCKLFHFFEEGTDSYMKPLHLEDFTRTAISSSFRDYKFKSLANEIIRCLRGFTSQVHSLPYHSQSYQYNLLRKYYSLSNYCFPGVLETQKTKISPNFSNEEITILCADYRLNESILLIDETYPDVYLIDDIEYKNIVLATLHKLNYRHDNCVFIKLRPSSREQNSRLVRLLKDLSIHFEILPSEIVAEGLFLSSKNLKVIGFVSSLLFYASIFGHQSYSLLYLLKDRPKSRFDSINGFNELVQQL